MHVYENLCQSHDGEGNARPQWLELRKTGVTATDAAKLMTGGSWLELWAKKTGRDTTVVEQNDLMYFGNLMEPVTLRAYHHKSGRNVRPSSSLIRSVDHPWMLATLDATTEHPEHGWIPLELKNANTFMEDAWEDGAPPAYAWQARHQAVVFGDAPAASVACLLGGNRLMWADEIMRDSWRDRLLEVTSEFWWHCENDAPPPADGSKAARRILGELYDATGETIVLEAEFAQLDAEYENVRADIKRVKSELEPLEARKQEIENEFLAAMEGASQASVPGGGSWVAKRIKRKGYTVADTEYTSIRRKVRR